MSTIEEKKEIYDLLDFTDVKKKTILDKIFEKDIFHKSIDVSIDVYNDTHIDKWCETLPILEGSKMLINKLIHNPISDERLLKQRQESYYNYYPDFETLREFENDVLWVYKLDEEIKENNLFNVLYPSTFIISYINYFEPLLELYHMYKIYFVPLNVVIYPFLSLFAPWYYLNRYLKFNISISSYVSMLMTFGKLLCNFTGNIKAVLLKIITVSSYILLFAYNAYQTLEYSYMLYEVKRTLDKKMDSLNKFLHDAVKIIQSVPNNMTKPFVILNDVNLPISRIKDFTNIYKIWKHREIQNDITNILLTIYAIDAIVSISKLKNRNNWCITNYSDNTKMWNMKNPILNYNQVANPVDLSRNIVLTGPNAAGKTTYVKSILANIILSQTIGIVYAMKSNTIIYDTIVSFMRITDILGSKSYFEVEADYCLQMMKKAQYIADNNKKGLFMMDEPMHSTPPTEGMSTAFAVTEYIGNLPGTNIILTTHFHKLVVLEETYPKTFINLSVEAIPNENGFIFPYTVKRGFSYQCIAIELLTTKHFPDNVIASAINMKNKICKEISSR